MKIDWFTIGAQALNFLILVWLLKHFLYKPILQAVAAREKRIASELADAKAKKEQAQKEHDEYHLKNVEFDKERAALLTKATNDAKAEGVRLLEEARKTAMTLSAKLRDTMDRDAVHLNGEIGQRIEQEVFSIARKALFDLVGSDLDDLMVKAFIQRLKQLTTAEKRKLLPPSQSRLSAKSSPSMVRSSFNLKQSLQSEIQNAANKVLGTRVAIQFETDPSLVSGIEWTSNGQKIAWSISSYLTCLEKLVDAGGKAHAIPKPLDADAAEGKEVPHAA